MPRGGSRPGAGRKRLDPDDETTAWLIAALENFLLHPRRKARRHRRWLLENGRSGAQVVILTGDAEVSELPELREAMRNVPVSQRGAMISRPEGTPLEAIRHVLGAELGGQRWHRIPEPSSHEIGHAYRVVARLARRSLGIDLTPRQIERRVKAK